MSARGAERKVTDELLDLAELGRDTYEAITGLATNLKATPEFTDALVGAFFRRKQSPHTHGNDIPSVHFNKGGFGYLVESRSTRFEPGLHGEPENMDLIRSELVITKYDPTEGDTDGWVRKVAHVRLRSDFIEDSNTNGIFRFTAGNAVLEQFFDLASSPETPPSWRSAKGQTTKGPDVLVLLPKAFPDLYPAPVNI